MRAAVVAQQLQALNSKRSPSTPTRSLPASSITDGIPMAVSEIRKPDVLMATKMLL